jgi:hypothetical protein
MRPETLEYADFAVALSTLNAQEMQLPASYKHKNSGCSPRRTLRQNLFIRTTSELTSYAARRKNIALTENRAAPAMDREIP